MTMPRVYSGSPAVGSGRIIEYCKFRCEIPDRVNLTLSEWRLYRVIIAKRRFCAADFTFTPINDGFYSRLCPTDITDVNIANIGRKNDHYCAYRGSKKMIRLLYSILTIAAAYGFIEYVNTSLPLPIYTYIDFCHKYIEFCFLLLQKKKCIKICEIKCNAYDSTLYETNVSLGLLHRRRVHG